MLSGNTYLHNLLKASSSSRGFSMISSSMESTVSAPMTRSTGCCKITMGSLYSHRLTVIPVWISNHPTLACQCEFRGFKVWGKFLFWTLELMATATNLANQVEVGQALDQSCNVQSRGPEKAHQNNELSRRLSRTNRRLSRVLRGLSGRICFLSVGWKQKPILNGFFDTDLHSVSWTQNPLNLTASWGAKCQLTSWTSVSKKPCTWGFIILHPS